MTIQEKCEKLKNRGLFKIPMINRLLWTHFHCKQRMIKIDLWKNECFDPDHLVYVTSIAICRCPDCIYYKALYLRDIEAFVFEKGDFIHE